MVRLAKLIAGAGTAAIVAVAVFAGCPAQRASAQGSGIPAPSTVSAGGTTLPFGTRFQAILQRRRMNDCETMNFAGC
jgi:hypothetical protein